MDGIIEEMVDCTRELYKAGQETNAAGAYTYPFPFGGYYGAEEHPLIGMLYCIPEAYSTSSRDVHGQIDYEPVGMTDIAGTLYDYYTFPDDGIMSMFKEDSIVGVQASQGSSCMITETTVITNFCHFWCVQFSRKDSCIMTEVDCAFWKTENTMCESFISLQR